MFAERPSRLPGAVLWRRSAAAGVVRILPDGCLDIMLIDGRLVLAGPDTRAALVRAAPDSAGIRLPPGLGPFLLGVPAVELRDSRPRLDQVWDAGRVRHAEYRIEATGPAEGLEQLVGRLASQADPPGWTGALATRLRRGERVETVAAELGWSSRQLHRKCLHAFGYGPSTLAGILRFQRAVTLARSGRPLSEVAVRAGYADQPHLSRAARSLAGTTMTDVLAGWSIQAGSAA